MKLIIAGSRDFTDYLFLKSTLDKILSNIDEEIEIVSGACRGADKLGEAYAHDNGYTVKKFFPKWKDEGMGAGFKRNRRMAEYATHCVVFWVNESKGTKHMIDLAKQHNLTTRIISIQ